MTIMAIPSSVWATLCRPRFRHGDHPARGASLTTVPVCRPGDGPRGLKGVAGVPNGATIVSIARRTGCDEASRWLVSRGRRAACPGGRASTDGDARWRRRGSSVQCVPGCDPRHACFSKREPSSSEERQREGVQGDLGETGLRQAVPQQPTLARVAWPIGGPLTRQKEDRHARVPGPRPMPPPIPSGDRDRMTSGIAALPVARGCPIHSGVSTPHALSLLARRPVCAGAVWGKTRLRVSCNHVSNGSPCVLNSNGAHQDQRSGATIGCTAEREFLQRNDHQFTLVEKERSALDTYTGNSVYRRTRASSDQLQTDPRTSRFPGPVRSGLWTCTSFLVATPPSGAVARTVLFQPAAWQQKDEDSPGFLDPP